MPPKRNPHSHSGNLISKLRRLNLCGTRHERTNVQKTKERAEPIPDQTRPSDRSARPVISSELLSGQAFAPWQQQMIMEPPRVGISVRDREHITLVGESARQRRMNRVIRDSRTYMQDVSFEADSPAAARGDSSSGHDRGDGLHTAFSRRDRDGTLTKTQHIPQRLAFATPNYGQVDEDQHFRQRKGGNRHLVESVRDTSSYTPSEYSVEVPDQTRDKHNCQRPTKPPDIYPNAGQADDESNGRGQRYVGEVYEEPEVDLWRLSKMEIARRGVCVDCRRAGQEHFIIRGVSSLICSNCRQNHDCSSWEEVNDSSHKLLMVPVRCPPPPAAPPLRSPPGTLKPPPPLKDRALTTATPLIIPPRSQGQGAATFATDDDRFSAASPTSPIAVTKALPLPRGFPSRKSNQVEAATQIRQTSEEELGRTLASINPVGCLRRELGERSILSEVGPLPAIHAVEELSQTPNGEILRTGEVKASKGVYVERLTNDRCRDCK